MLTNADFIELLSLFEKHKVRYLNCRRLCGNEIQQADLIRTKEASGRPQDKIDVDKLKEAEKLDALDNK